MKKRFLNVAGMLAFGTALVLTSCSSDDGLVVSGNDGATDYEIANAQTLSVQVENTGDNMTRAGRPLYSSEAKQDINTVKVVIFDTGVTLDPGQTLDAGVAAKARALASAMVGNDKKVLATKTFENWMTEHVSETYTTNGHGRMASWSLGESDWITPATMGVGEDNFDRKIFVAYAVGYNEGEYSSMSAFESIAKSDENLSVPVKATADKSENVKEIFAGATFFNITKSASAGTEAANGKVIYKFNSTLTLHRQVAGVFGYLTDIPVTGNDETDPDQNKVAKTLRLVASYGNQTATFCAFNSEFTTTDNNVMYLVNGDTKIATADAKFYGAASENAYVVYSIDLDSWFPNGDANTDGVLNAKDYDANVGNWANPYTANGLVVKEGTVFGSSFVMPFFKTEGVATFQLQSIDADGNILRWWNIRIDSDEVGEANLAGVFGLTNGVKDATPKFGTSSSPQKLETADAYSIVRNHLYTIGSKDKDDENITDKPQSLGQQNIVLKVNDNWEMVHQFVVD